MLRQALLIGLLLISAVSAGCVTAPKPVALIGVSSCDGYVGDMVILSDGTILERADSKETADKIVESLGNARARMINPDRCPPTQDTNERN